MKLVIEQSRLIIEAETPQDFAYLATFSYNLTAKYILSTNKECAQIVIKSNHLTQKSDDTVVEEALKSAKKSLEQYINMRKEYLKKAIDTIKEEAKE